MSGIYGTVRPSNVDIEKDVDMYYYYRPTRNLESDDFKNFKPLSTSCLVKASCDDETLLGMYTLRLPVDTFNKKGFYTIYIKPKEYKVNLFDVSVLASYPSIRGIVIDSNSISGITDLTGYRVEYLNNGERTDMVRLITSSNRCVGTNISAADSLPRTRRYRLVDTQSNLLFCTVTPSSASSYRANYAPYIGTMDEEVVLVNTKFNPLMIEVEMVDHDADTISYMLEGDQVRDRDHSIITTYNDDKEIYHQSNYYTIKDKLAKPLYDVKETREDIDGTQSYDNIINGNN